MNKLATIGTVTVLALCGGRISAVAEETAPPVPPAPPAAVAPPASSSSSSSVSVDGDTETTESTEANDGETRKEVRIVRRGSKDGKESSTRTEKRSVRVIAVEGAKITREETPDGYTLHVVVPKSGKGKKEMTLPPADDDAESVYVFSNKEGLLDMSDGHRGMVIRVPEIRRAKHLAAEAQTLSDAAAAEGGADLDDLRDQLKGMNKDLDKINEELKQLHEELARQRKP